MRALGRLAECSALPGAAPLAWTALFAGHALVGGHALSCLQHARCPPRGQGSGRCSCGPLPPRAASRRTGAWSCVLGPTLPPRAAPPHAPPPPQDGLQRPGDCGPDRGAHPGPLVGTPLPRCLLHRLGRGSVRGAAPAGAGFPRELCRRANPLPPPRPRSHDDRSGFLGPWTNGALPGPRLPAALAPSGRGSSGGRLPCRSPGPLLRPHLAPGPTDSPPLPRPAPQPPPPSPTSFSSNLRRTSGARRSGTARCRCVQGGRRSMGTGAARLLPLAAASQAAGCRSVRQWRHTCTHAACCLPSPPAQFEDKSGQLMMLNT